MRLPKSSRGDSELELGRNLVSIVISVGTMFKAWVELMNVPLAVGSLSEDGRRVEVAFDEQKIKDLIHSTKQFGLRSSPA